MTLEQLYRQHKKSFIFKVYPYTHLYDVSEDLVQEAFTKAYINFPQYDKKKGALKGWFTKILFSCLWDYMREKKRHPPTFDIDSVLESDFLSYEENNNLGEYIKEIKNPLHKQVVLAHTLFGCNPQEVASVLPVSEVSVRKIIQRFREGTKDV